MRMMVVTGGTGGHIYPALAVAQAWQGDGHEVSWLGTRTGLEARLVPEHGIEIDWISVRSVRGKGVLGWMIAPWQIMRAVLQARCLMGYRRPDVVLVMGGFVSVPGVLAARSLGIPVCLHEQNAIAGLSNRLCARLVQCCMQAFAGSLPAACHPQTVGNPVRAALLHAAVQPLGKRTDKIRRVLVLGGSLGARSLNLRLPQALAVMQQRGVAIEVRHQAGKRGLDEAKKAYTQAAVIADIHAYLDDMAAAYRWADVVVCRAGAMTLAELTAMGCAALLVPYPHAVDDHQTANAMHLARAGAAFCVADADLLAADDWMDRLYAMLNDDGLRQGMAQAARQLARPEAGQRLLDACMQLTEAT